MVSLCQNKKNKHYRVIFDDATGARRTLRLGKIAKAVAESIRGHVRNLRKAKYFNETASDATLAWLNDVDPDFRKRLEAAGLVAPLVVEEKPKGPTLGEFLAQSKYYSRTLGEVTGSTRIIRDQTAGNLLKFYGADNYLADFDADVAAKFRAFLFDSEELAVSTANKRCSVASSLFAHALRRKLVEANPFVEIPKAPRAGKNGCYVTNADAVKILAQFDDPQRRLLFALGRWAGLRIGSEVRRMRWRDIDMERKRFTVRSPKTIHHRPTREVPMFPELVPLFAACAVDGEGLGNPDGFVLPFLKTRTDTALRKLLDRAVEAAGLVALSRPWQNMRASCQTDLVRTHPIHVVCEWLGNSTTVAAKHYLRTTDADFEKAAGIDVSSARTEAAPSPKPPRARNAARSSDAEACTENPQKVPASKNPGKSGPDASLCNPTHECTSDHYSPARIRT